MKMNKEIKQKWVAALRSGEYKQGHGYLRIAPRNGKQQTLFCCLGVLCNLHAQAHPEIAAVQADPHTYMGQGKVLPPDVCEWAGLAHNHNLQQVTINGYRAPLFCHNDTGRTFEELAKAIENQL